MKDIDSSKLDIKILNANFFKLVNQIQKEMKLFIRNERKIIHHDINRLKVEMQDYKETFKILQGKWTIEIIYMVNFLGKPSFNKLKKALPGISSRILTDRLKFLEQKRIIHRTVRKSSPIRVFYKLSTFGNSMYLLFVPLLSYMKLYLNLSALSE